MVMSLVLGPQALLSLKSGCNLYAKKFSICVLTVTQNHQNLNTSINMFFRERERPAVDVQGFIATALPKLLLALFIVVLNTFSIVGLMRSNKWANSIRSSGGKGFYFLPPCTQGLLHSLFVAYLLLGLLTIYSNLSLSAFLLLEWRWVEEGGEECLLVNCAIITLSLAITLHLLSLTVDRTLASQLSYSNYTHMAKGTVPLWLMSIWVPALIMGALPLTGWRNDFSFCIFLHQFKDEYLRFIGGFHCVALCAIPFLHIHIKCWLRPHPQHITTIYRWQRKLQSHHHLAFIFTLVLNALCWTPFHLHLLLACSTCPFPQWGTGFLQEYLFIFALAPATLIPLLFTIRSSHLSKCTSTTHKNPLSPHCINTQSPLFSINTISSTSLYKDTLTSRQKGSLFVPRYLPPMQSSGQARSGKYVKKQERVWGRQQHFSPAHSPSTQETDSQCGFPMPILEPIYATINSTRHHNYN